MAEQFDAKTNIIRAEQREQLKKAQKDHRGTLDFSAYQCARSPCALGFQGSLFLGRNYGQDSTNIIATMDQAR
jgi:hypothetical protein